MKVIGMIDTKKYLVEIEHTEIEKFLNLYYDNMKALKVGDELNLGKGYDWYIETKNALDITRNFFKSNAKTIDAVTRAFINDANQ